MTGVPRDFLWLADSSVLLITDYAVSKRTPQGTWTTTSFPCLRSAQTGCVLRDGTVVIGGHGGILTTQDFTRWKIADGVPTQAFIRALAVDERTDYVFAGGWGSYNGIERYTRPGTGLLVSGDHAKSFQPHPLTDRIADVGGRLSINAIEVQYYGDQQLILIGGEGSGPGVRRPSPDYPFLFILRDDRLYDPRKLNLRQLSSLLGQDIITPQHGIKVSVRARSAFVSSWARDIAFTSLDAIAHEDWLSWTKLTAHLAAGEQFGAGHLRLGRDVHGRELLFVGGAPDGPVARGFTPIRAIQIA